MDRIVKTDPILNKDFFLVSTLEMRSLPIPIPTNRIMAWIIGWYVLMLINVNNDATLMYLYLESLDKCVGIHSLRPQQRVEGSGGP